MKSVAVVAVAALSFLSACGDPNYVKIQNDDAALVKSRGEVAATLPIFWKHFDAKANGDGIFTIKADVKTEGSAGEHIWIDVTGRKGDEVTGTLADDPHTLAGMKMGSPVTVHSADIEDWTFDRGGKTYGGYSIRAFLNRMSTAEQNEARAHLADMPLPPEDAAKS